MTRQNLTKDERYVLSLFEMAKEMGELTASLDKYAAGDRIGIHQKSVNNICKLLIQANFIKKEGESSVVFTSRGLSLAEKLLDQKTNF